MSTSRDKGVLNMILSPFISTSSFAESVAEEEKNDSADSIASLAGFVECEQLELEGVKFAEAKNLAGALQKFSEAIQKCPKNPSPYNNRAQVHRLQGNTDEAMADLDEAIALSADENCKSGKRLMRIVSQAYVQRALVHQLHGQNDEAKADYERAAEKGSTFAKTQLVALNPYSAMCNKMLSEVMSKVQSGIV